MGFSSSVRQLLPILGLAFSLLTSGCVINSPGGGESPPRAQTAEKAYSATPTVYGGSLTNITATATFARYDDSASGLTTITTNHPIRYAEYHLLDANGGQIQQGETDGSGNISLFIPQNAGTYTLSVNSRADNSYYRASVLNNPYDQNYYSLKTTFSMVAGLGSAAISITPAPATNSSTLEGGAFNILDQIFIANQFLRDKANDSSTCSVCTTNFVSAPKIPIYWTKGLSPATYYGSPSSPISFFLASQSGSIYRGLYILGGVQDSVCTDTDHFDRSVILHEYAHYLESYYSKASSPGGSHNGDKVIDPRLAWSEGWANFFQAVALGRSYYRDTVRNSGCANGTSVAFPDFDLETKAGRDVPGTNEGIFREISVSRMLFDNSTGPNLGSSYNLNYSGDAYSADVGFGIVWHTFKAMANSTFKFQNAGIFNQLMTGYLAGAGFNNTQRNDHVSLTNFENHARDQSLYGQPLTVQPSGSCTFSFAAGSPEAETKSNGVITYSNPLRNNGFFRYDYDGNPANALITLRYKNAVNSTNAYDLDLYVYKESHTHLDADDLVKYSNITFPEASASNPNGLETIDLNGQSAGTYMINVKVSYLAARLTTTYYLDVGSSGARLCP
jgi:hypothetical protein